jgi:farnesyl-diphosphate farnesyltransferase
MAIATLALCFDNHQVFERNVKIRKGLAVKLMQQATSIDAVRSIFKSFCLDIAGRVPMNDPNALQLSTAIGAALAAIDP